MHNDYWRGETEQILNFIAMNKNLIIGRKFDELYKRYKKSNGSFSYYLTGFLLYCGLNPLNYLTAVPDNYAYYDGFTDEVTVPRNISKIGCAAFSHCDLHKVTVESKKPISIEPSAFLSFKSAELIIKGEIASLAEDSFDYAKTTIVCSEATENKIREICGLLYADIRFERS